jgi:hypothetical protein
MRANVACSIDTVGGVRIDPPVSLDAGDYLEILHDLDGILIGFKKTHILENGELEVTVRKIDVWET